MKTNKSIETKIEIFDAMDGFLDEIAYLEWNEGYEWGTDCVFADLEKLGMLDEFLERTKRMNNH